MKLNLNLVKIVSILSIILFMNVEAQYRFENEYMPPKPRKKLLEVFAENIINYFDLENKMIADSYFENFHQREINSEDSKKCDNPEEISNYFLESYSGKTKNMTNEQLESLISFHVTRGNRDNNSEYRSRRNKCKRRKVKFITNWPFIKFEFHFLIY